MAKLHFKYATMNSGKTLDLIRTTYNYEENGFKVLVIKPAIDKKGNESIVSRVGLERRVDFLIAEQDNIIDVLTGSLLDIKCIFVDEAQFLTKEQIDQLLIIAKVIDITVVCYGLRTNFKQEAFEGSKRLLELSDKLEELPTICECGEIARFVGRQVNDEYVLDGQEVVIDGTDSIKYIPLCGKCYLKKVLKKDLEKIKKKVR